MIKRMKKSKNGNDNNQVDRKKEDNYLKVVIIKRSGNNNDIYKVDNGNHVDDQMIRSLTVMVMMAFRPLILFELFLVPPPPSPVLFPTSRPFLLTAILLLSEDPQHLSFPHNSPPLTLSPRGGISPRPRLGNSRTGRVLRTPTPPLWPRISLRRRPSGLPLSLASRSCPWASVVSRPGWLGKTSYYCESRMVRKTFWCMCTGHAHILRNNHIPNMNVPNSLWIDVDIHASCHNMSRLTLPGMSFISNWTHHCMVQLIFPRYRCWH